MPQHPVCFRAVVCARLTPTLPACSYVPVVMFRNVGERVIVPFTFEVEVANIGVCRRIQVPLKLAWALTVHKCQGMSLDYCSVRIHREYACPRPRTTAVGTPPVLGTCHADIVAVGVALLRWT